MAVRLIRTEPFWVEVQGSRFHVRALNAEERAKILEAQTDFTGEVRFNFGVYNLRVVEEGLLGWENVYDDKGNEVPFERSKVKLLPADVITELANYILGVSQLTVEEEQELRG